MGRTSIRKVHGIQFHEDFADTVGTLAFSPNGTVLVTFTRSAWLPKSWYAVITAYNVGTGTLLWQRPLIRKNTEADLNHRQKRFNADNYDSDMFFTPDGSHLVYGTPYGKIEVINMSDASLFHVIDTLSEERINAIAWNPFQAHILYSTNNTPLESVALTI